MSTKQDYADKQWLRLEIKPCIACEVLATIGMFLAVFVPFALWYVGAV